MKTIWFRQWGPLYIPVHFMGLLITLLAILLLVPVFLSVIRNAHTFTDGLYQVLLYGTCIAFWWKWIADKTSI